MGHRVWANADSLFDRLVVLSPDHIAVANPDPAKLDGFVRLIASGQPAATTLGAGVAVIPVSSINRITANKAATQLDIKYDAGGTKYKNIDFKTAAERDQFLDEFAARFASEFVRSERKHNPLTAAGKPVVVLAIWGGATAFCYSVAATQHAPGSRRLRLISRIAELLGTTGVLVVGGVIAAILLVWLASRVARPPTIITIARKKA